MNYRTLPLLRLLLAFVSGIVVYDQASGLIPSGFGLGVAALSLLVCFLLLFNRFGESRKTRWLTGLFLLLLVFAAGIVVTQSYHIRNVNPTLVPLHGSKGWLAEVVSLPKPGAKSVRLEARVLAVEENGTFRDVNSGILLYFPLATPRLPSIGQTIAVAGSLRSVPEPLNPGAFNYKVYLARRGVHYQAWLAPGRWMVANHNPRKSLFYYSELLRQKMVNIVQRQLPDRDVQSVAAAILLGYDDLLDSELRATYSGTGAMHVLCVSGLHVGIFYAIFAALLFPLSRSKWGEATRTVLLLLLIWSYAVLTGLSPSVSRSATMFTFVALGKGFHRRTSVLNSLMASAFFLLCINPYYLFSAGFQLSFAAVAGIVTFQPVLAMAWPANNKVVVYFRDLVTVSIAAQLFTMPVTLLGFHQFPNYFLLSNMVVIPLSFLILVSGMATLALFWLPWVGQGLSWLLGFFIGLMNHLVGFIERLPGSVTHISVFGFQDALLLFVVVGGLLFWLVMKHRQGLLVALASLLLLVVSVQIQRFEYGRQQAFVVADGGKHLLLGTVLQRQASWLGSASEVPGFSIDALNRYFAVGGKQSSYKCLGLSDSLSAHFLVLDGCRVVVIDSSFKLPRGQSRLKADWVIVGSRPRIRPGWVIPRIDSARWVLASNLSEYLHEKWKKALTDQGIAFQSVKEGGAVVTPR